jgi:hypothetical protein
MNFVVISIIVIVILLLVSLFNNSKIGCKNKRVDMENDREDDKKEEEKYIRPKVLKYFGGAYCPHSREGSRAYELVKDFEAKYKNIDVQYFWSGEEGTKDEFMKADARYVPTLTNCDYTKIEMSVPQGTDTSDKTQDELKELVMKNMYNQL